MENLNNKIKNAAKEVKEFNSGFGFSADINEIAADVWSNHLNWEDRLLIMKKVGEFKNKLEKLRACYSFVAELV